MREQGMRWHLMVELEERGSEAVIGDAIAEALEGPEAIYLSVDIDVVDPGMAPGTGTPEAGGMLSRELLRAVRQIVTRVDLVGMDVVELSPAVRPRGDHGAPRAPGGHGGDQRAGREDAHESRPRDRGQPQALGRVDADPHGRRLLRRGAVPRRPRRRADRAVGARGGRRRRREDAPACAVPFRPGHAVVGAPRRARGHRRRLQRAGDRVRARARGRGGPRRPVPVPGLRRLRPPGSARGRDVRRRVHRARGPRVAAGPRALGGRRRRRS